MKTHLILFLCLLIGSVHAYSQDRKIVEVTGVVTDDTGEPLIGVSVVLKDEAGMGVITNIEGKYTIKVREYSYLIFSYLGFEPQERLVKDTNLTLNIIMAKAAYSILDEVTVTGTGVQKKLSLTGAVTAMDVKQLKTATSSVTNALAGNVPGIMARQTSGQPGENNSEFWIRGVSTFGGGSGAMILVDGFERSMDEINVEDIEDFTVLKDAAATAIYGSRGANGAIIITTKKGTDGKTQVSAKGQYTYTRRTYTPRLVDGITYAELRNEAYTTRNLPAPYTEEDLHILRNGLDPDLFPNVNWQDVLLKSSAPAYNATVSVQGGGTKARYYLSGGYLYEGGMYREDKFVKDYSTNPSYERFNYRMRVDMDVTSTTKIDVGIAGTLENRDAGGRTSGEIWESVMRYNPTVSPLTYSNGYTPAISTGGDRYLLNPWTAATQTGYLEDWTNKIQTNITLEQKLDFVTKGLLVKARFAFDVNNRNQVYRRKLPELWQAQPQRDNNGELIFNRIAQEEIMWQETRNASNRKDFFEADLSYNRTFNQIHDVKGILKYTQDNTTNATNFSNDIIAGVNRRHQGLAGEFSYGFDNRYYASFVFGYNGSENFAKGKQWGFFPAYSVAWNVAQERFIRDNEKLNWIEMFKIRYSYGEVGNDNLKDYDRFPYLDMFPGLNGDGYYFNADDSYGKPPIEYNWGDIGSLSKYPGLSYKSISSKNVTWEIAKKHNVGIDLNMFKGKLDFTIDYFYEKRTGIYWPRSYMPDMVGLGYGDIPRANTGAAKSRGFDGVISVRHTFGQVEFILRGNMTYSKSEVLEEDELYSRYPYSEKRGYRVGQLRGLVAEGLFKDYDEIRNSPTQFGDVMPGDIKYKDINGDGKIDNNDIVPIGATEKPNLIYGFGLTTLWKGLDVNIRFQGAGKSNFFINGPTVYPFQDGTWGNILQDVVDSNRWIEGVNEDPNAKYPRLSYGGNSNNYRPSTYWLRDGSYLRLKELNIGYTLPKQFSQKLFISSARFFFIAENLMTFAKFKLWDPELGSSNGQKYPLSKSFSLGISINI